MKTTIQIGETLITSRKDIKTFLNALEIGGVEFNVSEIAKILKKHPSSIREALSKIQEQNTIQAVITIGKVQE